MFARLATLLRDRWHPLWRLRQISMFRRFQEKFDRTILTKIPPTNLEVAVRLLRDASWIANPSALEPEVRSAVAFVLEALKPKVFWDVGANIGFYSWWIQSQDSVRHVILLEPDPLNFALLSQTIRTNGLANCWALNLALANSPGEAPFLVDRASGATGSLDTVSQRDNPASLHHAYGMQETIPCRTATVDSLIAEGVPPPDLMKIDVEGTEHLVLEGATECLARHRPALVIETKNAALIRRLQDTGYIAYAIDPENILFIPDKPGVNFAEFRVKFSSL
jgi:FkbM family methyltransferase